MMDSSSRIVPPGRRAGVFHLEVFPVGDKNLDGVIFVLFDVEIAGNHKLQRKRDFTGCEM